MESAIRQFRALPIKNKRKKKASKVLLEETIKRGIIFSPEVVANYTESELLGLIEKIGLTAEQINNSFHKSWQKIKEASIEQLWLEQVLHYITTYGFEALGIYDESSVYVPNEKLEIPEIEDDLKLIVIKGYTKDEFREKLIILLNSGIALSEDTLKDILDVAKFVGIEESDIVDIKNKEAKVVLYDHFNLFPENPLEFLRYVVYKITNKTLLIKSANLIEEIREGHKKDISKLFEKYGGKFGFARLAEIFYRFKPIFLALRTNKKMKRIVNRIRKLAVGNHKPLPEDYLNNITSKIKKGERINKKILLEELKKVNVFRKIRLAYALKFRTKDAESILYRIRNGRGFATDFSFDNKGVAKKILDIVLDSISDDIEKNVKGKKVYIPDYINYSLPATEKQFTGNFPSGTYISVDKDIIVGINWQDIDTHRIDLDLSLIKSDGEKIGWDASYRTEESDILFSGDMTSAPKPKGATELFYVQKQSKKDMILFVNYYNYNEKIDVPFKIIVAKEKVSNFKENYMVDPNNIVSVAESKMTQKQKILGLLITTTGGNRFYFAETSVGKSITSTDSKIAQNCRQYLLDFYENTIDLKSILIKAGCKIVKDKEKADIDLSPEVLEKDSILKLLI